MILAIFSKKTCTTSSGCQMWPSRSCCAERPSRSPDLARRTLRRKSAMNPTLWTNFRMCGTSSSWGMEQWCWRLWSGYIVLHCWRLSVTVIFYLVWNVSAKLLTYLKYVFLLIMSINNLVIKMISNAMAWHNYCADKWSYCGKLYFAVFIMLNWYIFLWKLENKTTHFMVLVNT